MTVERYKHETKMLPCRRCGVGIEVGIRTRKFPVHYECGIRNMHDAVRQMHLKSGPLYDKWVLRMTELHGRPPRGTPSEATSIPPRASS